MLSKTYIIIVFSWTLTNGRAFELGQWHRDYVYYNDQRLFARYIYNPAAMTTIIIIIIIIIIIARWQWCEILTTYDVPIDVQYGI